MHAQTPLPCASLHRRVPQNSEQQYAKLHNQNHQLYSRLLRPSCEMLLAKTCQHWPTWFMIKKNKQVDNFANTAKHHF